MKPRILRAPAAAGKTQYCLDRIQALRREEPLGSVWVVLPDSAQVRAFRRRLAQAGGAFNVHIVTFSTLYIELLALAGEALPRLDEPVLHRLLQSVVDGLVTAGQLPYYAPLQDKPGFYQALRRNIRELKQARIEPERLANAVADQPPRLQELALIYGRYQQWLQQEEWADNEGRGWLAELLLQKRPDLCRRWRLLLVDGFAEFNPVQLAILGELAGQVQEMVVTLSGSSQPRLAHHRFQKSCRTLEKTLQLETELLPSAGEQLPQPLAHLEAALFERSAPPAPPANGALTLLEAPSRAREVRAALRWLKQQHVEKQVPLSQLAVMAYNLEAYRPFLLTIAAEFGLPLQISQGSWLHQNPAVAALLDLLALPRQKWPRRQLLEAWRSPYFDWADQQIGPDDADRLAAAARHGQIITGREQWQEVLQRLAQANEVTGEAETELEEPQETAVLTAPRGPRAAALWRKLEAFTGRLSPPPQAPLREYVAWLEGLIGDDPELAHERQPWQKGNSLAIVWQARYGSDDNGRQLSTAGRDVAALQRLKDVLRSLIFAQSALHGAETVSYAHFLQELRGAVEATTFRVPPPEDQETLLAAPLAAARGLSFEAVALLGLCEGEFPRQLPQDPLLREPERQALVQAGIALEQGDVRDQLTLFYEAVTRARTRLLVSRTYLAGDGQAWEASPFWEQLQQHSSAELIRHHSADVPGPGRAASAPELLAALAQSQAEIGVLPTVALQNGWQAVQAGAAVLNERLAAPARGPFEGDLSRLQAVLRRRYDPQRPWSASRLESYAVCPFFFFSGYALGFEPRQPVAAGYDVRQLGSMYHAILEEVYRQKRETGKDSAELLPETAQKEFDEAPEKYGFRPTPLWHIQRQELTQILLNTVKALDEASEGWQPLQFEPPFGLADKPALEIEDKEGRSLRLRGYIDRVDVDEQGRLRIIDYKSSSTPISSRALEEGSRIQLALYALAARDVLQLGQPAAGMYWHIGSARPSYLQLEKQPDGIEAALAQAVNHALNYVEAIRQGHFEPNPPDGGCPAWCPAADFCWRYTPRDY